MKRIFDIFFSALGILLFSPLFIIIGIFVLLDSKGGMLFSQERIGKNGSVFKVLKFRTMHPNSFDKGTLTIGNKDPRVTSVGYYLRNYKLDELPQLFNVLMGDMSFVGPRPEVEKYTRLYNDEQKRVLSVKPGITDYASIKFRNESEILAKSNDPEETYIQEIMPEKLRLNMKYIDNQSVFKDIAIIFNTLYVLIKDPL
ncbi:MAG: glycosyl transferase [Chryseobacterium sp. SCN 40-13]|nr:MAG: glycosyl transferase [Chryseobacterium sp. SCN 40-13]